MTSNVLSIILLLLIVTAIVLVGYYTYRINNMHNQQMEAINSIIGQLQIAINKLQQQNIQFQIQAQAKANLIAQLKKQITDIVDYQPIDSIAIVQYIELKNYEYYGQVEYGDSFIKLNEEKLSRFIGITKHLEQQNAIKGQIITQQDNLLTVKDNQINNLQNIILCLHENN